MDYLLLIYEDERRIAQGLPAAEREVIMRFFFIVKTSRGFAAGPFPPA
jgi:hypothetical protein